MSGKTQAVSCLRWEHPLNSWDTGKGTQLAVWEVWKNCPPRGWRWEHTAGNAGGSEPCVQVNGNGEMAGWQCSVAPGIPRWWCRCAGPGAVGRCTQVVVQQCVLQQVQWYHLVQPGMQKVVLWYCTVNPRTGAAGGSRQACKGNGAGVQVQVRQVGSRQCSGRWWQAGRQACCRCR